MIDGRIIRRRLYTTETLHTFLRSGYYPPREEPEAPRCAVLKGSLPAPATGKPPSALGARFQKLSLPYPLLAPGSPTLARSPKTAPQRCDSKEKSSPCIHHSGAATLGP